MPILHAPRVEQTQPDYREAPQRHLEMCALFSGGETMTAIAKRYGISRERVRQILKKNGLSGYPNRVCPIVVMRAVETSYSVREVVQKTGFPATGVFRAIHTFAPTAVDEMQAYRHERVRQTLLDRIRRLAARLGRTPRKQDFDKYGPGTCHIQGCFGSLTHACHLAGLQPNYRGHPHLSEAACRDIAARYRPGRDAGNSAALAREYGVTQCYIPTLARRYGRQVAA